MPADGTITHQLRRTMQQHAGRVAIEELPSGRSMTYAQLDAASGALAARLALAGVGPGVIVPLVMPRCAEYLVAVVAILRLGAAYAPIDPAAPRRQAMLEPLDSPVVIGQEPGMLDPATIADDGDASWHECAPEDPAYVMYTSGTTGTPKGVVVPHRGIVRLVINANYARFDPSQRWGVLSAVAFDASTLEIWGALLHGGCCVVQTMPVPSLEDLASYFTKGRVSDTWLTASLFNAMVDEHPAAMAGMGQLFTGGERESVPHIRRFRERCPGVTLIHGYGPTENTTFSLCHTITEVDAKLDRIPIGTTINGSTMRIVEPGASANAPERTLLEGELLVGGDGLALGYLNDEQRTAEKFVTDSNGERWYRTGDLVRLREDGAAVFTGRVDRQVKIRGHRVEPDGVEAQLAACPGVSQAAIAVAGDTADTRQMIAFYVPQANATTRNVREQLAQRLPRTLMPDRLIPIGNMPVGPTGKLDRSALTTDPQSIWPLLRRIMDRYRDRTAIEEWPSGRSLTYGQLDSESGALARTLLERGVMPGSFVPIILPRCADYIIAVVAILRCGAAYAPIDPAAPRRWQMLEPLNAAVAIGRDAGMLDPASILPITNGPDATVGPTSPAYVMYTSGTTGVPKGVVVPHQGVTRLVHLADYAAFDAFQRWGVMSATAFDLSTLEIWGALLHGGCCVVQAIPLPNTAELAEYLVAARITETWLTATLFNAMVDEHPHAMAHMNQLFTGGERESAPHIRSFKRHCPDVTLIHGYGPTENTTFSLCHTISAADAQADRIPIGRPINSSTMRIVAPGARADAPAQPLRAGELLVGGLGLALGYLNDPAQTSARFVTDARGERWYRTGDLVSLREDDAVVFTGRVDRQVKIRGHRVEPDGVEAQLAACPGVSQAAIAVAGDTADSRHMIAFFVPKNETTAADARDQLAERLPPTMLPDRFIRVDAMPMGTTGKVDRAALMAQLSDERATEPRAATATEARLMALFAHRLGRAIGPEVRFQDAGGHSLLAMRLSADVHREFGVQLSAGEILRKQTISSIAIAIEAAPQAPPVAPVIASDPIGDIRRRVSLEHARDVTGRAMLVHHAWHVSPALPLEQLREAWLVLLERHDALRTSVRFADDGPALVEHDPRTAQVFHAEHDRLGAPHGGDPAVRAAALRTIGPNDPPARMHAWSVADGSQVVLMVFHHASIDEWSLDLITDELHAILSGIALPVAEPYDTFVRAEHANLDTALAKRLAERIAMGSPAHSELPPGGAQPGVTLVLNSQTLDINLLLRRARSLGVSPAALVAAAFSTVLQVLFGPPSRWLMTPIARRGTEPLQRVVGCCLDICVLEAASGSTIESLARSIHEQLLDAQCDRTLPLEILTQHLRARAPERSGDATRFGLTYRHIDDAPRTLGGSMAQLIVIEQLAARFGLCLHVEQRTSGLRVWLEASSSYFSLEALRQIGASFTGVLEGRPPPPRLQVAAAARLREAQYAGGTSGERVVLAELWHKLLGSAPTEMSDFFTSGGSSLLAMRLAAAVHKRLGRRLMLNQFLRRPTLDGLVNSIRDDIEHPFAEFSDARADEDRSYAPWCVAIPGSSGRAIDLYRLWSTLSTPDARAIDMLAFDLKTIGIGEQDTFDTKRFFSRFTALTHAYAIANDRRGPITVMGYSLGGLVALDMARTLADLGHTVERIVLLDAYAPQYLRRTPAWLLGKLNARVRTLGKPATPRRPQKIEHDSEDAQAVQISRATWRLIHHELGRWRPSTLLTHTTLVRSSSAGMSFRPVRNAATNGLGPWLRGPLDVRVLDVEHLAMLTADADRVAEALRSVLTQPRSAQPRESRESQPSPTANRRA